MEKDLWLLFGTVYGVAICISTVVEGIILTRYLKRKWLDGKVILLNFYTHLLSLIVTVPCLFLMFSGSFIAMNHNLPPGIPIILGLFIFIFGEIVLNELIFSRMIKKDLKGISLPLKPFFWGNLYSFILVLLLSPLFFSIG